MSTRRPAPVFVVRLRAGPKVDAIRALRAALESSLRERPTEAARGPPALRDKPLGTGSARREDARGSRGGAVHAIPGRAARPRACGC